MRLEGVWHRYPGAEGEGGWTLRDIDFHLAAAELVGLLGPSGCGKTTLLRLIAGFERPQRGRVLLQGHEVAGPHAWLPPERRGVGMVFQDYALFPHLDAWRNVCFGLRPRQDRARAAWLLELLGLDGLQGRFPHELSGGQRQRLALARALAPGPAVLLLDEPFSNLDVEVRLRLRAELPAILRECGTSGLIVTHDPEEALAICDRVAVLEAGRIHQCASPRELVRAPATPFVGRFVLQANVLPARRQGRRFHTALGSLECAAADATAAQAENGAAPQVLFTPAGLDLVPDDGGDARVVGREFLGQAWLYQVRLDGEGLPLLRLRLPLEREVPLDQRCRVRIRRDPPALLFPQGLPLQPLATATIGEGRG